uniref:Uncharacterized protein n=1 Tax=Acrobeloides nanus TaxID=290746 RepID=A0A914E9T2_9BILA
MDELLGIAASQVDEDFTSLGEPQTPDEKEIHATRDFKVYSIYERHRAPAPTSTDEVKFRIKSVTDTRPSECTETGRPGSRVVCPTSNNKSRWWSCLKPSELCDGIENCYNGEDENPMFCMFYKASMQNLKAQKHDIEQRLKEFHSSLEKLSHLVTK